MYGSLPGMPKGGDPLAYRHLLPQARLRFVLADDPGAGSSTASSPPTTAPYFLRRQKEDLMGIDHLAS
jgi:hypothetical protein